MTDDRISGPELAAMRLSRGLSQADLGKLLGKSRVAVNMWERGRERAPPKWIRRWFRGYDDEQRSGNREADTAGVQDNPGFTRPGG